MPRKIHAYYVYMMTNEWRNVLYTGVTNSLVRRVWEHKNGAVPGFTKQYNCHLRVHHEVYQFIQEAIAREKQIKGWSRAKKNALVATMNPKWLDLAAEWFEEKAGDPSPRSAPSGAPPARDDKRRENT